MREARGECRVVQALISQGVEWVPRSGSSGKWVVKGREGEKFRTIVRDIGGDECSPEKVSWLLTATLHERYERAIADVLSTYYRIEHKPRPGQVQPRWFVNGVERAPGPVIERVRTAIARTTGYFPAQSEARERRILELIIKQQGTGRAVALPLQIHRKDQNNDCP